MTLIEIGFDLWKKQIPFLKTLGSKFAIITDDLIEPLYGRPLRELLLSEGLEAWLFAFPHGETNKTRITKEALENQLFEKKYGRDTCIIAIGGGVVTDLVGFLAATYCRGVPLVLIPTSLLAMVDAAIGGKTAVNLPYGKNLIGAFYPPKKSIIDLSVLQTLPKKELLNGFVETIKHALISDHTLFDTLERHAQKLLDLDPLLEDVIKSSCQIKQEIVAQDEKEKGMRHLLNFGHTIGHALEHLTDYTLSHGYAVALGILVESYISLKLNILDYNSFERIKALLITYGLPLELPYFPFEDYLETMKLDKKSLKNEPRFVMIEAIGKPHIKNGSYSVSIPESLLNDALYRNYRSDI